MLSLHYISRDEYNNADASSKTSDKLFFLSDTHEIFRGTENFTESVIFYDEEPTTKIAGKLYINQNTLVGRIWNGIDWITVAEPQVQSDYENNDNTSKSFILNRPFYDSRNTISRTYGFDGSTNGKTVLNTADVNAKYIKVSDDLILNKDILVGGTLVSVAPNSEGTGTEETSISIDQVYTINANESGKYVYALVSSIAPYVLVAKEDCSFIDVYSSDSSSINITAGVYFLYQAADNYVKSLTFSYESGELKTIDPKFIPWESSPAAASVLYTEQTLTDEQKTQARTNIGAGAPQVQSDYTQNDNTQSDHIKNRPFYEDASISIEWDGDTADKTQVWSIDNHEVNENLLIKSFTSASSSVVSGKLVIFAIKPETPSAFDTTDYSAILYNETTGSLCEITLVSASNGSNLNHPSGVLQFRHKVIGSKGDVYTFRAWIVDPDGKVSANSMTKNITIR